MDMFGPAGRSLEEIEQSPEVSWLHQFGNTPGLALLAEEEMAKSQEIFEAYFSNRNFR
jgi:hypothetical protein